MGLFPVDACPVAAAVGAAAAAPTVAAENL